MIRVRLQIENGEIKDTYDAYGLIYLSADHRFAPPIKDFEKTSYPEQAGENTDNRTVDDAFDYKVTFFVECPNSNLDNANVRIKAVNDLMYSKSGDIKTFKEWTLYNDYKKVKIVGIPQPIEEAKEFWRDNKGKVHDCVQIELTLHVSKPHLCDFSTFSDMDVKPRG